MEKASDLDAQRSVSFAVFSTETNRVVRRGTCQWRDLKSQAGAGEVVWDDPGDFDHELKVGVDEVGFVFRSVAAPITARQVKYEAGRRLRATDWMVMRAMEGGKPVPPDVLDQRTAIRAASDRIEQMVPIPPDFAADHHWTDQPASSGLFSAGEQ